MRSERTTKRTSKTEEELPRFSNSLRVLRTVENGNRNSRVNADQTVNAFASKLVKALERPGIDRAVLFSSAATPVFRAHPKLPGLLIRSYKSGKEQTGRIDARGVFRVWRTKKK